MTAECLVLFHYQLRHTAAFCAVVAISAYGRCLVAIGAEVYCNAQHRPSPNVTDAHRQLLPISQYFAVQLPQSSFNFQLLICVRVNLKSLVTV